MAVKQISDFRLMHREHYRRLQGDGWTAKTPFAKNDALARTATGRWNAYQCGYCRHWHLASTRKGSS